MSTEVATRPESNVTRLDERRERRPRTVFRPNTDIVETDDSVIVEAEMPGVARDTVDITLENRVLTLRGSFAERNREGWRAIYSEYAEGDYERAFTLSEDIDREKINATFKNGVLRLELPKAETAKTRKIAVKAA